MGAPRKFDHDHALDLYKKGLSLAEIATRLRVAPASIKAAVDPLTRARKNAELLRYCQSKRKPCVGGCGTLVWMHVATTPQGNQRTGLCRKCWTNQLRNKATHGTEGVYRWCKCDLCTSAASQKRRERRERSKVPCSHGCGTLVLAVRRNREKPPECRECYNRVRKQVAT